MNILTVFLSLIVILSVQPAFADKPNPDDLNKRLNAKFEILNNSLNDLVDQAVNENGDMFTEAQKNKMLKEKSRAESNRQRVYEAGGMKRIARKAKVECIVKEIDTDTVGNNDGICENDEICEEKLGDQLGDEDGKCELKFCGKKEVCVEICDEEAVDSEGNNYDLQAAEDMEETLDDVTWILDDTSRMLKARSAQRAVMTAIEEAPDPNDKCALLPVARQRAHTYDDLQGMLAAATVTDWAHATCDSLGNQDWLGNNWSAACTVLAVAAGIANEISVACELQDDTVTAEQVDASVECIKQMSKELAGIREQLDEIIILLNTPQGRRPTFPEK